MKWLGLSPQDWQTVFWIILVGAVCNASCALLGCYLVLRRLSLLGDAISHAVLPGIVVGYLLSGQLGGWPILLGAVSVGVLTAFLTQTLHSFGKVPEDASMGAVFTSLFALGVILISATARRAHIDLGCVLFGQLEFAAYDQVPLPWLGWEVPLALKSLGPSLIATLLFVGLLWKELKICSFDPMLATALGINANRVHYLLMAMVAVVTVAALEAVGAILVVAMLIVPAATAHLMTDRLGWMMAWAVAVGVLAAAGGSAGAVYLNANGAGMMAVAAGLLFLGAVFLAPRHGLISQAFHNLALSVRIVREDLIAALYRLEEKGADRATGLSWQQCRRAAGGGLLSWLAILGLWRLGQIERQEGGFRLTATGWELAQTLVRAHRLWEAYLAKHFVLPPDHLHEPASRIEHYIDPTLQEELAAELNRPVQDPHGRPIPPAPTTQQREP